MKSGLSGGPPFLLFGSGAVSSLSSFEWWCCFLLLFPFWRCCFGRLRIPIVLRCGVAFTSCVVLPSYPFLLVVPSALGLIAPLSSFWCCLVSPSSLWVVLLSPLPCGGVAAFPCAVWWCCLLFLPAFLGLLGWVLLKSGFEN